MIMAYDYHYAGGERGPRRADRLGARCDDLSPRIPSARARCCSVCRCMAMTGTSPAGGVAQGGHVLGRRWNAPSGLARRAPSTWPSQSEVVRYADDNGDKHEVWFESCRHIRRGVPARPAGGRRGVRAVAHRAGGWRRLGRDEAGATEPVAALRRSARIMRNRRYFPETRHNLLGGFNGSGTRTGASPSSATPDRRVPRVNPQDGRTYTVQYFERARFEWHPDTSSRRARQDRPGSFGAQQQAGGHATRSARLPSTPDKGAISRRLKHMAGWVLSSSSGRRSTAILLLGLPLSEEVAENGKTVQYFEFGRLEVQPRRHDVEERVSIAILGTEVLRTRGWAGRNPIARNGRHRSPPRMGTAK